MGKLTTTKTTLIEASPLKKRKRNVIRFEYCPVYRRGTLIYIDFKLKQSCMAINDSNNTSKPFSISQFIKIAVALILFFLSIDMYATHLNDIQQAITLEREITPLIIDFPHLNTDLSDSRLVYNILSTYLFR